MEFDRRTLVAFLLIGLVLILINTRFYQERFMPKPPPPAAPPGVEVDSSSSAPADVPAMEAATEVARTGGPSPERAPVFPVQTGEGEDVVVETPLYTAVLSTRGATLRRWTLKQYHRADGAPVQMIGGDGEGNLAILLPTEGDTVDTAPFVFSSNRKRLRLTERQPQGSVEFVLEIPPGRRIKKVYRFQADRYDFRLEVELVGMEEFVEGFSYFVGWRSGLAATEPDFKLDMSKARAYAHVGSEEALDANKPYKETWFDDPTDWVAIRTKYFAVAVIPEEKAQGARLFGEQVDIGAGSPWKKYGFDLQVPYVAGRDKRLEATVFLGPLDYDVITSYNVGLEQIMDLGWALFRPFGKFVLWCFEGLHQVIPNYGFVIVVFSVLIKLALYPLTRKSYRSMKEMQTLQPLVQEINEKYKNDPQKKQQEIMRLYKEQGVNPLGGCIPMLLQMPLLIALFQIFQSTIELRQAPFIWWITDLSRPDTVATIPSLLPFNNLMYGTKVNVLPLFMGVTMFIQQKMSMKDPKQKAMVYFMPVFFTLLFNSFPSGLNLYYSLFNLFTIAQEKLVPYKKAEAPVQSKLARTRWRKHDYRKRLAK